MQWMNLSMCHVLGAKRGCKTNIKVGNVKKSRGRKVFGEKQDKVEAKKCNKVKSIFHSHPI